jgi:predicted dienelactone hydrolase
VGSGEGHLDPSRIGVAGFSLGGYTSLATVGARLAYEQWKSFCASQPKEPTCIVPPEAAFSMADVQRLLDHDERVKEAVSHSHDSFRDARIGAAFAIAPVLGPAMTKASLAEVRVPVRIIVGSKDDQALPDVNVAHYTFLARCNLLGKVVARSLCTHPDDTDREDVHRRVSADALRFFDRTVQRAASE